MLVQDEYDESGEEQVDHDESMIDDEKEQEQQELDHKL